MKFTLSDCIVRLNQILNYPSLSYVDVSHFFDQAISEINSELHIGLRPISEIYKNSEFDINSLEHFVVLEEDVNNKTLSTDSKDPIYYDPSTDLIHYGNNETANVLYGLRSTIQDGAPVYVVYRTVTVGGYNAYWVVHETSTSENVDLSQYLPNDWIILFLIPYVCFRYAVRDGDTGATYAEDFGNGFQQLRNSYSIPCTVNLSQQAGKEAYKQDLEEHLPNINIQVPTRAIYEDMRVERNIAAQYGGMFDRGGWGF